MDGGSTHRRCTMCIRSCRVVEVKERKHASTSVEMNNSMKRKSSKEPRMKAIGKQTKLTTKARQEIRHSLVAVQPAWVELVR